MKIKVTMNLEEELLKRLDDFSEKNYMPRSTTMSIACNQYLIQNEMIALMSDLRKVLQRILETGEIDEKTQHDMNNFIEVCKLMQGE